MSAPGVPVRWGRRRDRPRPPRAGAARAVHPVVLFGLVMTGLERRIHRDRRGAGLLHASAGLALGLAAGASVRSTALATSSAVAGAPSATAATDVERSLHDEDLVGARALLPALVGVTRGSGRRRRCPRRGGVRSREHSGRRRRAGALGRRRGRARRAWATAPSTRSTPWWVIDRRGMPTTGGPAHASTTLSAWVPARLTAAFVVLVRPEECSSRVARRAAPGPRASVSERGVAEAAFAAALGVRLGGVNHTASGVRHGGRWGSGGRSAWMISARRSGSRVTSAQRSR